MGLPFHPFCSRPGAMTTMPPATQSVRRPELVVAADWSKDEKKRWMVRAELQRDQSYIVFPPEPVGEVSNLLSRLLSSTSGGTVLVGFDFPIGLPDAYAQQSGFTTFREALETFGIGRWERFYEVSDTPSVTQPFYPRPKKKGQKGKYPETLARSLGVEHVRELLRQCDLRTDNRSAAGCLFYTLGGKQVGPGAIVGWRDVLQPAREMISLWPFDGTLEVLLAAPGPVAAEIYPGEAYSHLGIRIGTGTGRKKTRRPDRKSVAQDLLKIDGRRNIMLCEAAKSWVRWGFQAEDDFDAMVGLLSMLLVVTGERPHAVPSDGRVRGMEGWILGQLAPTPTTATKGVGEGNGRWQKAERSTGASSGRRSGGTDRRPGRR